jgi:hypothetical protein
MESKNIETTDLAESFARQGYNLDSFKRFKMQPRDPGGRFGSPSPEHKEFWDALVEIRNRKPAN